MLSPEQNELPVQESMGPRVDRSREHLGSTDRAVIVARQVMLDAIKCVEERRDPPGADPTSYRHVRATDLVVPRGVHWQEAAQAALVAVR